MDINLNLIIFLSLGLLGVVIYLIIMFTKKETPPIKTKYFTHEDLCKILGYNWNNAACKGVESFTDPPISEIPSMDQLYNINDFYKPKELKRMTDYLENMNESSYFLPILHFHKCINLENLNFTTKMNDGFVNFNILLNKIVKKIQEKFSRQPFFPDLLKIMNIVNLVLYYNKIEDENNIIFNTIHSLFIKAQIDQLLDIPLDEISKAKTSISFTKCLPSDNLYIYIYNRSQDELKTIDCDRIKNTDGRTFYTNLISPSRDDNIYKISLIDYKIDTDYKFIKYLSTIHIKDYKMIIDAYIKIIQFYIDNSIIIDSITSITDYEVPEDLSNIDITNKPLIQKCADLIFEYINAINYVLPDFPSELTLSFDIYDSSNISRIQDYINTMDYVNSIS